MNYFDRYLGSRGPKPIERNEAELISLTCVLLAAKFVERQSPVSTDPHACLCQFSVDDGPPPPGWTGHLGLVRCRCECPSPRRFHVRAPTTQRPLQLCCSPSSPCPTTLADSAAEMLVLEMLSWRLHVVPPHAFLTSLMRTIDHGRQTSADVRKVGGGEACVRGAHFFVSYPHHRRIPFPLRSAWPLASPLCLFAVFTSLSRHLPVPFPLRPTVCEPPSSPLAPPRVTHSEPLSPCHLAFRIALPSARRLLCGSCLLCDMLKLKPWTSCVSCACPCAADCKL